MHSVAMHLLALLVGTVVASSRAMAGLPMSILDQTGCSQRCPSCDHVCKLEGESVEVEREGFVVESKIICVPRVVFPWQRKPACGGCTDANCEPCYNGGRTRRICVLKTEKFRCSECEYTWTAKKINKRCKTCSGSCGNACQAKVECDQHIFYLQSEHATGMISDGP
jgi:hypothetical protein